ncbi:MAG: NAD-dependent epimerase/dehydratase family protein [Candidatus Eisenbacteria bacterium]|nr:NAD-dependent epimerase/dehydratase family protein [Candidatus Eisenbacteria bacterium]
MHDRTLSIQDVREIAGGLGDEVHRFTGRCVLITGGSGFLGRAFTDFFEYANEQLLASPCRVVSMDNHIVRGGSGGPASNGVRHIQADVTRPMQVDGPVHFIIHAAGIASPVYYRKFPLETLETATIGTTNALRMAVEKGVEAFLYFSSSEIYGDPAPSAVPTPETYRGNVSCLGPRACYDESKRAGETLCYIFHGKHGVPTKIVRPFNFYGPGMAAADYRVLPTFACSALKGESLKVFGGGSQTRTMCYLSDGIAGCLRVLLLGTPGEPYNIGNTDPEISIMDLAKLLRDVTGLPLEIELFEYPDAYPTDEPMRRCPDLSKAFGHLGYRPRVGLRDGLRRFMAWAEHNYEVGKVVRKVMPEAPAMDLGAFPLGSVEPMPGTYAGGPQLEA